MTIIDEGKQLRNEIAKLRRDQRRRYSPEQKRRILDWVERAMADGMRRFECGQALGIKSWRIKTWQQGEPGTEMEPETLALVPIETPAVAMAATPTVVTPSGYRVEGLTLDQVAVLLKELA
jgi:transposase-like protein